MACEIGRLAVVLARSRFGGVRTPVSEAPHNVPVKGDRGGRREAEMGIFAAHTQKFTHRIANLRGLTAIMGKRAKQMTKQTRAPTLHPLKIRIRSHLLTVR